MSNQAIIADDTERLGLPSASSFERTVLCHGWNNLWRQIVEQVYGGKMPEETPSPEAARGTRIHKSRETLSTIGLQDESEEIAYERWLNLERELVQKWLAPYGDQSWHECEREQRLWITNRETGEKECSARLDAHYITGRHVLACDGKSGSATGAGKAATNLQLRVTAVCVALEYEAELVTVSLIKPEAFPAPHFDDFTYDKPALIEAEREVRHHIAESQKPDAPRHAGPQCHFCPCKSRCPEGIGYLMLPSVIANTAALDSKKDVEAKVAMLTPADWAFIWQRRSTFTNILSAVTASLGSLDDDTLASFGLRKGSGRTTSDVPGDHVMDACGKLVGLGLPESDLWKCLSINKSAVVELVMREHGLKKAQAEKFYEENLQEHISSKTGEPILREL